MNSTIAANAIFKYIFYFLYVVIQLHADEIDFLLSRTAIQFLQMCPFNPIYVFNMSKEVILFMFLY